VRLADAKPVELGHTVKADTRWRLYAFCPAGNPAEEGSAKHGLCRFLAEAAASPVRNHTPEDADIDSVIDLRAIFQQGFRDLALETMPSLLLPKKGRLGLVDYEKMFCPDLKSGRDIFEMRGIDRQQGCLVIVRPDQYVAHILPFNAHDELATFFAGFMLPVANARQSDLGAVSSN
jgi:phenol 2-monooxygenase